ncbi:hypothetical protein D3C72_1522270 [compost metagenome]
MIIHRCQNFTINLFISRIFNNWRMITSGSNIGCKISRCNVRNFDTKSFHFHSQSFSNQFQSSFRCRINTSIRKPHITSNRSNINNKPRILLTHLWQCRFHNFNWTKKVSLKIISNFFCRNFF